MASAYVVLLDSPATLTTPVGADAQYGDDGPANGPDPEFDLTTGSAVSTGRTTWNPDFQPDGSWDSGAAAVVLTVTPDGSGNDVIAWQVNGQTALTQTVPSIGDITNVAIVAGTQIYGSVKWSDVDVEFDDATTTDNYSAPTSYDPAVDTTLAETPTSEEQLWVTPTATDDTSVVISGTVEFTYPAGESPNPDDLFADVMLNAS